MPSPEMNLLWLTENYPPSRGGMAQSCDRIVHNLRKLDIRIDVVHLRPKDAPAKTVRQQNGRYWAVPLDDDPAFSLNLLWNRIEAERPEAGYTHLVVFGGFYSMLAGPIYAAYLEVPLFVLIRGNDFDTAIFSPKRVEILSEALRRSQNVCVVSQDKAHKIRKLFPAARVTFIPNGIDTTDWCLLSADRERAQTWREEHLLPDRKVLGIFGHIKPKKGGLFFLECLQRSGHLADFHLLFTGDIDENITAWLEQHADELHSSRFPFMDRFELLPHYAACDLVVIPSYYDGLPNVMLEAGSLGIPLLAARTGGMRDFLTDERHGFLFEPGDTHQCRLAIQRITETETSQLKQMGAELQTMIHQDLNQSREAENYKAIFSSN